MILQQGYTVFQSTLPRGERRVADSNKVEVKQISIHAPARGATKNYLVTVNRFYISIHAPARGATFVEKRAAYVEIFQSTLPRGERQHRLGGACSCHNFNPRSREGSDFNVYIKIIYHFYFNPRSREGSDRSSQPIAVVYFPFQSTLPRGERLHHISIQYLAHNFNPRSREGSDLCIHRSYGLTEISIHAPARGATGL